MKTERIDFADTGDFWEFRSFLTVAMEREWLKFSVDTRETFQNNDPALLDSLARRMDALAVGATVAWSYGPVTLETFYNIPAHHYAQVASRLGDLYSPLVVTAIERGLNVCSSLLSPADRSL